MVATFDDVAGDLADLVGEIV